MSNFLRYKSIIFVSDLNIYARGFQRLVEIKKLFKNVYSISHTRITTSGSISAPSILYRLTNKLSLPVDNQFSGYTILKKLKSAQVDFVWIENGVMIYPWILKKIKEISPNTVLISFSEDDTFAKHNSSVWYRKGLMSYDFTITTKPLNIKELKLYGAKNLKIFPNTFFSFLHKKYKLKNSDLRKYKTDVSSIGAYEKERADSLKFLAINGIKIVVWGSGWSSLKTFNKNLIIKNRYLFSEEYPKAITASKININFLRKINRDEITSRSIEIPACNSFMLTERSDMHQSIFKDGVDVGYFSNNEELLNKIRFYLKDNIKRKKCSESAYNKVKFMRLNFSDQFNLIMKGLSK